MTLDVVNEFYSGKKKVKPENGSLYDYYLEFVECKRKEEKRILFKNILIHSITTKNCSYDKTEKYFRILEQMNSLELLLLKILKKIVLVC